MRTAGTAAVAVPFAAPLFVSAAGSRNDAKVAIAACTGYGPEVFAAMDRCLDLIGGIGSLVKGKTVSIKINLTGTNFTQFMDRHPGETYMTHEATAVALTRALFRAGAKRVRLLESTQSKAPLETSLGFAQWNLGAFKALGDVEVENTRNLGKGSRYSTIKVPGGGLMFSSFEVNHSYADTDVMVSLCKMKDHLTTGVTLSMKNMFGLTPNTLYGDSAGDEDATGGRGPLHTSVGFAHIKLPGLKEGITSKEATWRVPRIIVDEIGARPIDLAIIDGITTMSGGEGPWCGQASKLIPIKPGVLIVGRNPVSTDSVGTALMGYDPRAARGTKPFHFCDNHIVMAEAAGLGIADLSRIEVLGERVEKVRTKFAWT